MIKFIIPVLIFFLIILFWNKINELIYKNFKIRLNYTILSILLFILIIILILLFD